MLVGLSLTASLTSYYWASHVFNLNNYQLTYGGAMASDQFHILSFMTAGSLITFADLSDLRTSMILLLGSSLVGYNVGMMIHDGHPITYTQARLSKRMLYAGVLFGLGLGITLDVEPKAFVTMMTAGGWGGYFLGKSLGGMVAQNDDNCDINLNLMALLVAKTTTQSYHLNEQPKLVPFFNISYKF